MKFLSRELWSWVAKIYDAVAAIVTILFLFTMITPVVQSQSLGQWYRVPAPGDVQRIFIASDSTLFACTNTGLYRENLQTGNWDFYTSANGFIGNNITGISSDSEGSLYFASSPVSMLKGNSFSSFPLDTILNAFDVLVDRRGSLWCSSWDGVHRLTPSGWTLFASDDGDGVLAQDSSGNIWYGAGDSYVSYYDSLGWHVEGLYGAGIKSYVTALTVAPDGTIWVGTTGICLGRRSKGSWSLVKSGIFSWYITGIAVRNDTVWVADRSLFRGVGSSWTQLTTADGLADSVALTVTFDRWGRLWVGHPNGYLSILENGKWKTKKLSRELPDFHVSSVAASPKGLRCVGTENGGLAFFDGASWHTVQSGLPSDTVTVVRFDHDGNLWVGTTEGIGMYNGNSWRNFTRSDGLLSDTITSITVSNKDSVWCSTAQGLSRFNGMTWDSYLLPMNIAVRQIRDLAVDSAGTIWTAGDSGILRFKDGTYQHFYPITKHSGTTSIAVDQYDVKWCGSDSAGVWQYNDTTWASVGWPNVGSEPISSVRIGPDGSIWAGSSYSSTFDGGLYQFDRVTWTNFNGVDGLADGSINDIAFDKRGNVWTASQFGVTVYNKNGVILSVPQPPSSGRPSNFELFQNYPNPFNPSTTISYELSPKGQVASSYVTLKVYDILGRQVATLVDGKETAGAHTITWNASAFASGVYFYKLVSLSGNQRTETTKGMVLIK